MMIDFLVLSLSTTMRIKCTLKDKITVDFWFNGCQHRHIDRNRSEKPRNVNVCPQCIRDGLQVYKRTFAEAEILWANATFPLALPFMLIPYNCAYILYGRLCMFYCGDGFPMPTVECRQPGYAAVVLSFPSISYNNKNDNRNDGSDNTSIRIRTHLSFHSRLISAVDSAIKHT